mgnify:CR=1 FL=1
MNWFTRLFTSSRGLIGQRLHAWHYGPYGCSRIIGEVVDEDEHSLYLDISKPEQQEFRAWRRVWRHDARPLNEALPVGLPMEGT